MLGRAFLARALGSSRLGTSGLDEGGRVVALLFEFSDALLGRCQLGLQGCHELTQLGVFRSQMDDFFLKQHTLMNTIEVA
jgi:hypothetical protein